MSLPDFAILGEGERGRGQQGELLTDGWQINAGEGQSLLPICLEK
jgi:hypothetical protein